MDKTEILARCEAAIRAGNDVAEAAMALRDSLEERGPEPNPNWQHWAAVNTTAQIEDVKSWAEHLLPYCGEFVVHTKSESVNPILIDMKSWCAERFPQVSFIGGVYAKTVWLNLPIENRSGWVALASAAHRVAAATGNARCLVDFESLLEGFNAGTQKINFTLLRMAIDESGVLDCGVDFIFYNCEVQPNILADSVSFTALLAEKFPAARVMESNVGRPDWVNNPVRLNCAAMMKNLWHDRLYRRILVVHPDSYDKTHWQPEAAVEVMRAVDGKVSLWITGEWDKRPEVARLLAEDMAVEASR